MGLQVEADPGQCAIPPAIGEPAPQQATTRLTDSQAVSGQRNLAWVWLGSPTRRYPHGALGSVAHAGSLHALIRSPGGKLTETKVVLPLNRVFEDRVPRLVDLDQDGNDEILLIESDAFQGSSLVVYGLQRREPGLASLPNPSRQPGSGDAHHANPAETRKLVELARSPPTGTPFRWLNPVGVADFDGDGHLDVASVTTPHIGGVLTLYHYRPYRGNADRHLAAKAGQLVPFATVMDVSNHKMGALEQEVAAIVTLAGQRPAIIIPDMTLKGLHAFRWVEPGQWKELAEVKPFDVRIEHITARPDGACVRLADAAWHRVTLTH